MDLARINNPENQVYNYRILLRNAKERVDGFTKMLEKMWAERRRLIESREGNVLRNGAVTKFSSGILLLWMSRREGGKSVTLRSQDRRSHHHHHI